MGMCGRTRRRRRTRRGSELALTMVRLVKIPGLEGGLTVIRMGRTVVVVPAVLPTMIVQRIHHFRDVLNILVLLDL